jgi:hypothetical protein
MLRTVKASTGAQSLKRTPFHQFPQFNNQNLFATDLSNAVGFPFEATGAAQERLNIKVLINGAICWREKQTEQLTLIKMSY